MNGDEVRRNKKHRKKSKTKEKRERRRTKKTKGKKGFFSRASKQNKKSKSRHRKKHGSKTHGKSKDKKNKKRQPEQQVEENLGGVVLVKNRNSQGRNQRPGGMNAMRSAEVNRQNMRRGRPPLKTNSSTTLVKLAPRNGRGIQSSGSEANPSPYRSSSVPYKPGNIGVTSSNANMTSKSNLSQEKVETGTTTPTTGPTRTGSATTNVGSTPANTGTSRVDNSFMEKKESKDNLLVKKSSATQVDPEKLSRWLNYAKKTISGGMDGIREQFKSVSSYITLAATRNDFDANMEKNRFEDVICMDHTRVRLEEDKYINASWVNISCNRKAIISQLPARETASDFWQMILENNVQAVLLLITGFEMKTFAANGVFPKQQDFLHFQDRHIRVGEFKRVEINKYWTLHVLSVRNTDKKRFIHLHHYSGWHHGREPRNVTDIWQIQSVFRKYNHPHVYASLSGSGRAGSYAVFEMAHDRLHSDCILDVPSCITTIRDGRLHAMQRTCQLAAVHLLLLEHMSNNGLTQHLSSEEIEQIRDLLKKSRMHQPLDPKGDGSIQKKKAQVAQSSKT